MASLDPTAPSEFSPHRRTAAILVGEGTYTAYLAGALRALAAAGVRIDIVLARGAGAIVAAMSAIDAGSQLEGESGLLARAGRRTPWQLRGVYKATVIFLAFSFAAFLSPVLVGLAALLLLPLAALGRVVSDPAPEDSVIPWLGDLMEAGAPFYLRAMVVPLIVVCLVWLGWWVVALARHRRPPVLPEPFELGRLSSLLEAVFWQAARGASTESRPQDHKDLGHAYGKLLSGSLGQRGFRELVFYALDTDSGQEVAFAVLKERFFKQLRANRLARRDRGSTEPIDLTRDSGLFFDALVAASSPPGLVPSVAIKLPLGTVHGGEVHRFSSSLFAGGSAVADAIAAGAEQLVFIAGCAPGDRASGSPLERVSEAAMRRNLSDGLTEVARASDLPVFLIRPDKQRLTPYEITGRAQLGNERLDLVALAAHGERDAMRLFVEPVLGEGYEPADESTIPIGSTSGPSGPREL